MTTEINSMFLHTLLLAEITRFKFGKDGMSLTRPTIERNARHSFAAAAGIKKTSKPEVFISSIKQVDIDNGMQDRFNDVLTRFKLDSANF